MISKSGNRFSEKIMLKQLEWNIDSNKNHLAMRAGPFWPALAADDDSSAY
jgi:hypothetical protein